MTIQNGSIKYEDLDPGVQQFLEVQGVKDGSLKEEDFAPEVFAGINQKLDTGETVDNGTVDSGAKINAGLDEKWGYLFSQKTFTSNFAIPTLFQVYPYNALTGYGGFMLTNKEKLRGDDQYSSLVDQYEGYSEEDWFVIYSPQFFFDFGPGAGF